MVTVEPSSCTCKIREKQALPMCQIWNLPFPGYQAGAAAVVHRGDTAEGVELEGDLDRGAVLVQAVEQLGLVRLAQLLLRGERR